MATSRKQSGRRPLKILLRIVCHFTCERSRSERTGPALILARRELGKNGPRCSPRFVRCYFMVHTCNVDSPIARYLPMPHWLADLSSPWDIPSRMVPRRPSSVGPPRRTNCTLTASLVGRWDCQERTARISGPTFRCPVLSLGQTNSENELRKNRRCARGIGFRGTGPFDCQYPRIVRRMLRTRLRGCKDRFLIRLRD